MTEATPQAVDCTIAHLYPGSGGPARSLAVLAEAEIESLRLTLVVSAGTPAARLLAETPARVIEVDPGALHLRPRGLRSLRRTLSTVEGPIIANTTASLPPILLTAPRRMPLGIYLRNSDYSRNERLVLRASPWLRPGLFALAPSQFALQIVADRAAVYSKITSIVPDPIVVPAPGPILSHDGPLRVAAVTWADSLLKGIDLLARVVARTQSLDICWIVFGIDDHETPTDPAIAGPLAELRVHPQVKMAGRSNFPAELPGLDVVLITSRRESFSRVAAEAMAAGVPVVAPRHTALPATLADGKAGLLYEPGDVEDASIQIGRLVKSTELRAELGRVGQLQVEKNFTVPIVAARLVKALSQVGR